MTLRMTDRLVQARRRRFVGRSEEQQLYRSALTATELPFQILYIFGPGGVGKTTLLREFATISEQAQQPAVYLDARNIEPTPAAFVHALHAAMGIAPPASLFELWGSRPTRHAILIDTYETLAPLDAWLRDVFLPELPQNVLVVLASRNPPDRAWRADPGWDSFFCSLPLRNLTPDESRSYLERRAVPSEQQQTVLDFTHGHPLALSLVADVYAQRPGFHFQPEAAPDIIKILLEQFAQKVPGPAHRAALEACSLVRVMTEALLAQMLHQGGLNSPAPDLSAQGVHDLFEWLRGLSFIEASREGIFPHDLARETLAADLRWRNPDWHRELHNRARRYYTTRIQQTVGLEQQRTVLDLVFLHRDNPVIRSMLEWQTGGGVLCDGMRASDRAALVAMVAQHEGAESAALAAHWLARQPGGATVYREDDGTPAGFILTVELNRATADEIDADPATRAAWQYLHSHTPLRPGEVAAYYRFWMARDTYQQVSPIQTQIIMTTVRYQIMTPGLAYHFLPCANPDFWTRAFRYANLVRLAEADFEVGGKKYGLFAHDWRTEPPFAWLAVLAEREQGSQSPAVAAPPQTLPIVVLSEPDFGAAVRSALHEFTHADALLANPLVQSRLVTQKCGATAGPSERAAVLQALIKQAAESLEASPRDAKLYRALQRTYLQPVGTQEQVAEILDLPFSTFRRHLKSGMDRLTEILWHQEIGR